MPATINGIGTHYYGAQNRSARVATCKQCGRSATLSSYDTREWFCILFIPLIPMQKFRILNDCSRCRKHYRISQADFATKLAEATAPIKRAIRTTPSEPAPHIELVSTLIGWEMRGEAAKELQTAMTAFPQNVDLMVLGGQLAVDQNDFQRAVSLYERAYSIDPTNAGVSYGFAWVLQHLELWEKAIPVLQRAVSQEANKKGALYLLGKSHMKLQHWNDALHSFQQLLSVEPAFMKDKALLRLVRECKQHLGYELTDAERRAGRRWWPFGGGTKKRAPLQPQPTLVRPSLRYAGIAIVAIMVIGSGFYAWDRWTNLQVYFDNGLDKSVKVELDGRRFDIALNSLHKEEVSSGSHTAVIRNARDGKEIERLTFTLDKLDPFSAVMHDRFFVYNVGQRHVYRRANHGYAKNAENTSYSSELIGMQRFIEQRDVDYPFSAPPETIEADATSSVVHKVSFNVVTEMDLRKFALVRLKQGKENEAKAAIALAVKNSPCDAATRRTQLLFAGLNTFEAANNAAKQWIGDCSQDDLEAHRAYQDLNREQGRQTDLHDEYQKMLASSPQSGKAHYLFGRVAGDSKTAVAEYQQAVRLDPNLIWPRVALGHAYQGMERYDDAIREFRAALEMKGCDPSVVVYYANAAVAKGQPQDAIDKVDEVRKAHGRDLNALHARWLLATAAADWDGAARIEKQFEALELPTTGWWRTTKRMRLKNDSGLEGRIEAAMKSKELHPIALDFKIERSIESGDFSQSADLIAKNIKDLDPAGAAMLQAYTAGGLLMQHDSTNALKLLDEAHKTLADAPKGSIQRVTEALVEGLRGTMPLDKVMEVGRDNDAVVHAWFVSAVRAAQAGDRKSAAESLAHCARASTDLDFPYLEAKAMAARLQ